MNREEQISWAKAELSSIMTGDQKTRYKTLVATPEKLLEVEDALLKIASNKYTSYLNALAGNAHSGFNAISEFPEAASASLLLQHNNISMSDISMLDISKD